MDIGQTVGLSAVAVAALRLAEYALKKAFASRNGHENGMVERVKKLEEEVKILRGWRHSDVTPAIGLVNFLWEEYKEHKNVHRKS